MKVSASELNGSFGEVISIHCASGFGRYGELTITAIMCIAHVIPKEYLAKRGSTERQRGPVPHRRQRRPAPERVPTAHRARSRAQ